MATESEALVDRAMREWAKEKGFPNEWVSTWLAARSTNVFGEIFQLKGKKIELEIPSETISELGDQAANYVREYLDEKWANRDGD